MTALIDDIGETAIKNMVVGEELKTKSPLGCQMIMTKIPWSTTIGKDTDGDGVPDQKLRYEFDNSQSVIEFPLGFCPAAAAQGHVDFGCSGQWGLVLKEWETITATYPQVLCSRHADASWQRAAFMAIFIALLVYGFPVICI